MSVFAGATAPEIGLTDSPTLAAALRAIGMHVHVGDDFSSSGKVLRAALSEKDFPLIVMDEKQIGIRAWADRMSSQHVVVVLTPNRGSNITTEKASYIDLPARIGDILVAAGFEVDANDPRLADVVDENFVVRGSAPAPVQTPAPAAAEPTPAPHVEKPAPVSAPKVIPDDLDDLFGDVPEAQIDDGFDEPERVDDDIWSTRANTPSVQTAPTPEPAQPVPSSPSVPDWMKEEEPAAQESTPSPSVPDWMKEPAAPPSAPASSSPALPDWMKDEDMAPRPAASHTNSQDDWSPIPQGEEDYEHRSRTPDSEVEEETTKPVFDAAPLDPGFDPNWEPEEEEEEPAVAIPEPVVDLSEEQDYIPVPPSSYVPNPPSAPEVPAWMQEATTPQTVEEEPEVVDDLPSFEIIDTVAPSNPDAPAAASEPEESFDDILAKVAAFDSAPKTPAPVVEQPVATPAPVREVSFDPTPDSQPTPNTFKSKKALCPIIVTFASKGGVGKTTNAESLAQMAAEAGLRVTLIDGNRGQGGVRSFLRVNEQIVSIYDAAVRNDPQAALAVPKEINAARAAHLPQVNYAVVLAPPDSLADPRVVTAQLYAEVVEYARTISDLVILDTQISERFDTTGIIESVAIPAIGSENGFGLGITDISSEGVRNLQTRLEHFSSIGIGREHLMSMVNKIEQFDDSLVASFTSRYSPYSTFIGVVGEDPNFKSQHNAGIIDMDSSTLAPAIRFALRTATGDSRFDPPAQEPQKSNGLFGRLRRR